MSTKGLVLGFLAALSMGATAAHAAICPPAPSAGVRVFTIDAPVQSAGPGGAECYDYGLGNPGQGGPGAQPYDTDTTTRAGTGLGAVLAFNDNVVAVPLGYKFLDGTDDEGKGLYEGLLSVTGMPDSPGTFTLSLPSLEGYLIIFKSGGGGTINPDWASFLLAPSAVGTYNWSLSSQGLSHVEVWGKTVVPIPAAAWLLGSGLIGLFVLGRRRKTGLVAAA